MAMKTYIVKKGPADPFRGNWYTDEQSFATLDEAIVKAAELTLANYEKFKNIWEEFGSEWSVFERENKIEKKIWEGFKYINQSKPIGYTNHSQSIGNETPDLKLGLL